MEETSTEPVVERYGFSFSKDWFTKHKVIWVPLIENFKPKRILEIGSFEGRSTCWIINEAVKYGALEVVCVDTWQGGEEHEGMDFDLIERRFDSNIRNLMENAKILNAVEVHKMKGTSCGALAKLMADHCEFDLIYIDGSHMATDVLSDAVMAFRLLRVGGVMVFDDYAVADDTTDLLHHPRVAIDAFMNIYRNKMKKIAFKVKNEEGEDVDFEEKLAKDKLALYQLYTTKIAE